MEAHVNDACIGCGLCTGISPSVFTMTDDGKAAAKDAIYPEEEAQNPGGRRELPGERHRAVLTPCPAAVIPGGASFPSGDKLGVAFSAGCGIISVDN